MIDGFRERERETQGHVMHTRASSQYIDFPEGLCKHSGSESQNLCVLLAPGASLNRTRQKNTQPSRISLLLSPNSKLTDREGDPERERYWPKVTQQSESKNGFSSLATSC